MKILTTLRNNWKKTIFFGGVLGYGADYLKTYIDINNHMRNVCNEVLQNSLASGIPKRVVVIVNPTANKKKCENFFKKYGEPVLHVAGYSVEILRTNFMGHAKTLIEEMSVLPDAIVIAGGDGTTSEVVTGLMRRGQSANCPIAILPLGRKSETAFRYLNIDGHESKFKDVCSVTDCITALIKENTKPESIMQYDVIEENSAENANKTAPKSVFGLNRFSWGLHRDIDAIKDKYWYFGALRHNAAVLFNAFSSKLNWNFATDFVYTPPCAGCQNCAVEQKQHPTTTRPYLRGILASNVRNTKKILHENKECSLEIEGKRETSQLNVISKRNEHNFNELETKFLETLQPGFSFMKNAIHLTHSNTEPDLTLKSRTIKIIPDALKDGFYYIDGEEYDIRPIKISLLQNAIQVVQSNHNKQK